MNEKLSKRMKVTLAASAICLGAIPQAVSAAPLLDSQLTSADVLIGYTNIVKNRRGGDSQIQAAIRQAMARANKANKDARTGAYYSNVAMLNFNYDDSTGDLLKHFNDWRANAAGTANGKTRNQWGEDRFVDIFVLITRGGGTRGWGGGIDCAITEGQAQYHTIGHEIGHCYNCPHSMGHNMATANGQRYTFMASGGRANSSIVDLYSNPFVKYQGKYTAGIQPTRYNALRIANNQFSKANRRTGLWAGGVVALKSNTGHFASSENGGIPMSASRSTVLGWENFTVGKVGSQWTFKGSNNRYVSSENGNPNGMNCNRGAVGSWERYNLNVSGGKIALQGVGGWVSNNNNNGGNTIKMTSNASSAGTSERWHVRRP